MYIPSRVALRGCAKLLREYVDEQKAERGQAGADDANADLDSRPQADFKKLPGGIHRI